MLTVDEIKQFIDEDATSEKKRFARKGQAYYDGEHDIKDYQLYYYNANKELVLDKTRSNIKISHPFFTELTDQAVQLILSGEGGIVKSDTPELQTELDAYFNENENFTAELSEVLTDCQTKGHAFMYSYRDENDRIAFQCADSIGVIEVEARFASDKQAHILYWYVDRIDKDGKKVVKILDYTEEQVATYTQLEEGEIKLDAPEGKIPNPRPHALYAKKDKLYTKNTDHKHLPFYRLDNNKKKVSNLKTIKALIDDYDLHACGLSNNLQDASEYLVVVAGYQGDDLEELIQNTKTKKFVGVDEGGSVDYKTVDIPYEARKTKLELDEKNIFRFGMGLNTEGLKDTSATTSIAIKAAYSLLELRCTKLEMRLRQFLRKLVKVVLEEINSTNKTDYQLKDVYFNFEHKIMSNELENAQIKQVEAQEQQVRINTLLNLAAQLDSETLQQQICDVLDLDWDDIKGKLPKPDEAEAAINDTQTVLDTVITEE